MEATDEMGRLRVPEKKLAVAEKVEKAQNNHQLCLAAVKQRRGGDKNMAYMTGNRQMKN